MHYLGLNSGVTIPTWRSNNNAEKLSSGGIRTAPNSFVQPINACFTKGSPGKKAKFNIGPALAFNLATEETKRRNDFATDESREGDWSTSALEGKTAVITGGSSRVGLAAEYKIPEG